MLEREEQSSTLTLVVRAGLAAVPFAGGSLATAWSDWDTNRRFKRVEHTLVELRRALEEVQQSFAPDRIGEAEMHILEAVLARVQSEHRERKRRQFAKLVASDWTERLDEPFEDRMRFVRGLDELDELHINILAFLAGQGEGTPSYMEIGEKMGVAENERDQRLLPALNLLASAFGFIRRGWDMSSGKGAILFTQNLSPEGIARKCEHTITEMGRRFLRAVSLPVK